MALFDLLKLTQNHQCCPAAGSEPPNPRSQFLWQQLISITLAHLCSHLFFNVFQQIVSQPWLSDETSKLCQNITSQLSATKHCFQPKENHIKQLLTNLVCGMAHFSLAEKGIHSSKWTLLWLKVCTLYLHVKMQEVDLPFVEDQLNTWREFDVRCWLCCALWFGPLRVSVDSWFEISRKRSPEGNKAHSDLAELAILPCSW